MRAWLFVSRKNFRQVLWQRTENTSTHEHSKKTALGRSAGEHGNHWPERPRLYREYAALASGARRPELSECGILWQGGMVQSGGLRKGPAGAGNDSRGGTLGSTEAGTDHPGRDQRKYWDRLRHDRRGPRLSRETVLAGQRQRRAQENSQGLWRRVGHHTGR